MWVRLKNDSKTNQNEQETNRNERQTTRNEAKTNRGTLVPVLYSVGNVRMSKSLSEDTMIRQGIVNRQAFVCTIYSILVGEGLNALGPAVG